MRAFSDSMYLWSERCLRIDFNFLAFFQYSFIWNAFSLTLTFRPVVWAVTVGGLVNSAFSWMCPWREGFPLCDIRIPLRNLLVALQPNNLRFRWMNSLCKGNSQFYTICYLGFPWNELRFFHPTPMLLSSQSYSISKGCDRIDVDYLRTF